MTNELRVSRQPKTSGLVALAIFVMLLLSCSMSLIGPQSKIPLSGRRTKRQDGGGLAQEIFRIEYGLPAMSRNASLLRKGSEAAYYFDCKGKFGEVASGPVQLEAEWSIDQWQRDYCQWLGREAWPAANEAADRNILFVDAREECERYRAFLMIVRQSGFIGHIVLLIYYPEDTTRCARLAKDFSLELFYHPSPRWEWTLYVYHGVTEYYSRYPSALSRYNVAAMVRPEYVAWCSNPFEDVNFKEEGTAENSSHVNSSFGGPNQTLYAMYFSDPRLTMLKPRHRSKFGKRVMNDNLVIGTPRGLLQFVTLLLKEALNTPRTAADPSWSFTLSSAELEQYTEQFVSPLVPLAHYTVEPCGLRGSHSPRCLPGERGVRIRHGQCYVGFPTTPLPSSEVQSGPLPPPEAVSFSYSPYCYAEYRYAISEVSADASIVDMAMDTVKVGANALRATELQGLVADKLFTVPAATNRTEGQHSRSDSMCPKGRLAVLSMLGSYKMDRVSDFISSFLHYSNPNCTTLVLLVTALTGVHKVADLYPGRVEVVWFTAPDSPFRPRELAGRGVVEERYEVARLWLELNHGRFRYVMNVDSRDYLFLADPLDALVRVLSQEDYIGAEFVGIVTESIALGSFGGLSVDYGDLVNQCAQEWLGLACGPKCYAHLSLMSYTNGEPYATLNSGQMLGTAIGMLHYYRFHVRMVVASKYDFSSVDQGLVTFYLHGILHYVGYPHKVLVFASSRSGFANPPQIHRLDRKLNNTAQPGNLEYRFRDCANQHIAGVHNKAADALARASPGVKESWRIWIINGSFEAYFQSAIQVPEEPKKAKRPSRGRRR